MTEQHTAGSAAVGATSHLYPRPGDAVRRVVVRNPLDHAATQDQDETDGTLRINGADTGPGASGVPGEASIAFDWVYVIAPDKVPGLVAALGGTAGDDVLALVAELDRRERGTVHTLLTRAAARATFSNWHS
jgi:hypothetical protein